ncbi:MAG: ChbG/HpnK family deacetylase [Hyphomicrobium sp.]
MHGSSKAECHNSVRTLVRLKPSSATACEAARRSALGGEEHAGDRTIMVCADDYAISRGVGVAIRHLAEAGRISATSCIVADPLWPGEAALLRPLTSSIDVGLHLTLTDPAPLGPMPKLKAGRHRPSTGALVCRSLLGRVDRREVAAEIDRQIDRFAESIGRLPDFIDGHHHVHILSGVREAVVEVFARRLQRSGAWLRFPPIPTKDVFAHYRLAMPGAVAIGILGARLRRLAEARHIPGNMGLRGIRRFFNDPPYAQLFERFLQGLGDGALIICHPGLASTETILTRHPIELREEEFKLLMSKSPSGDSMRDYKVF